ncbi:hypothetical protein L798_11141 [Zootermopsis nevadensis]|uniref:Uncharacterized protein n=1 Tax=Zootermopsis nevadensis TaxID=136037 RepID=A0A067RS87_ZOONE|nr:hypothetical protein L798_11141 [Zootermopsis nevadensis]
MDKIYLNRGHKWAVKPIGYIKDGKYLEVERPVVFQERILLQGVTCHEALFLCIESRTGNEFSHENPFDNMMGVASDAEESRKCCTLEALVMYAAWEVTWFAISRPKNVVLVLICCKLYL